MNEASTIIQSAAHEDANIIFGAVLDEKMKDEVKITVIATGFKEVRPRREHSEPATSLHQCTGSRSQRKRDLRSGGDARDENTSESRSHQSSGGGDAGARAPAHSVLSSGQFR